MKLFKKVKKGFTLIELVVVIAVVAILAAISVISFISINNKAKESHDNQIIDQVNLSLKADETLNGKPKTMHRALEALKEDGFLPANFGDLRGTAKDYTFAYSLKENKFVALKGGKISYPSGVGEHANHELWKIAESTSGLDDGYSYYLRGEDKTGPVSVKAGFDAGDNTGLTEVNYSNNSEQEVVIRTNGSALNINAPEDTVKHFGNASVVTLTAVGSSSYYEHGTVNLVDVKKGRLVITNDKEAEVGTIYLTATNNAYDGIILATQNGSELPDVVARESVDLPTSGEKLVVTIQTNVNEEGKNPAKTEEIYLYPASDVKEGTNGYNVSDLGLLVVEALSPTGQAQAEEQLAGKGQDIIDSVKEEKTADLEDVETAATMFAGGTGSEAKPFLIANAEHWDNFYQIVYDWDKDTTPYFALSQDVDLSGKDIHNYAFKADGTKVQGFFMTFDLDGRDHTIIGVENLKGYAQLFPYIWNASIHDITINYNMNETRTSAMVYYPVGDNYFTNVTTTGSISTTADWATAYVSYMYKAYSDKPCNVYYTNCTNEANIKGGYGNYGYTAVFGSHNGGGGHITFDNCKNYGGLLGGYVGFVGMGNDSAYTFVDENAVKNYGTMKGTKNSGYFNYNSTAETKTIGGVTCNIKQSGALATKSATHIDAAPENYGEKILINEVSGATRYELEMGFSIQVYNYDDEQNANRWSGGFPRSMKFSYSDSDVKAGKIDTGLQKSYLGEIKANNYHGYGNTSPSYEGIFLPEGMTLTSSGVSIIEQQGDVYLVSYKNNTFLVMYSAEHHGSYSLLCTNTSGEITTANISISFSVCAYNPNGSVLSFSSFSYSMNVQEAMAFFNGLE